MVEEPKEEEKEDTPPRRKGKVIHPISDPDPKPHINDLLAKEESSEAGAVIEPPTLPEPTKTEEPAASPAVDSGVATAGAESAADEQNEINKQIQDFVDHQTEAVEQGDDDQPQAGNPSETSS